MSARATALVRTNRSRDERALKVVRRRKRKLLKRSEASKVASVAIATAIGLAAVIAAILLEQVALAQSAFKLADIRKDVVSAEDRHEELLLEFAQLGSAARIEHYARDTLGMVDPIPGTTRYIVADVRGAARANSRVPRARGNSPSGPGLADGSPYAEAAP